MADREIQEARERFEESQDGSFYNREDAYNDVQFSRLADQWPDQIRKTREAEGRPCLTVNRLPAFIRQVVNDARQNKPSIAISPVDNGADIDTARVIGGLIRSVERHSQADLAYDTAIDHAVTGGFGFFRIDMDYAHEETFDLEARIRRVPNPFMVHWDVNSTEFDSSDWEYAFVSEFLTPEKFEQRYPKASKADFEGDLRDDANYWLQDDNIRVAEYWERKEKTRKIVLLSDGITMRVDRYEANKELFDILGVYPVRERDATYHEVTRRLISGVEVLEEDEWPGSMIPIVPVWGEEVFSDGRRYFRSMIRDAKDPQRMFNFWRSAATELVALAPRAPWLIQEGSLPIDEKERAKWGSANTRSHAYLSYRGDKPDRMQFASVPAGAIQEALNASDDMKAIIGIYDSALGARSNEISGRAILARQREADVSNFHFIDNLSRAIRHGGRILVDLIPAIYSQRQSIRILGEDEAEKVIALANGEQGLQGDNGERLYNLAVGKYDVSVSSGPSYQTQREETTAFLLEIMRQVPGAAAILGDMVVDYLDFPNADKIAERLRMLLPPQVQQAEGMAPPVPPGAPVAPAQPTPQQPGPEPGFSLPGANLPMSGGEPGN